MRLSCDRSLLSGCVALVLCTFHCCLVVLRWSCVPFTIVRLCCAGHVTVHYCLVVLRWSCVPFTVVRLCCIGHVYRLLLSGCVALVM